MIRPLLAAAVLCLAGCSTATAPPPPQPPAPAAAARLPAATPLPVLHLRIPEIGVDQPLEPLGRDQDGRLAPPAVTEPMTAGWYQAAPVPGDRGPAILAGHVSGRPPGVDRSVPGVFAHLKQLTPGDTIQVDRDGQTLRFAIYRVGTFNKREFPTADVYGDTTGPELRLITCGGVFNPDAHSYASNVVVWARMVAP